LKPCHPAQTQNENKLSQICAVGWFGGDRRVGIAFYDGSPIGSQQHGPSRFQAKPPIHRAPSIKEIRSAATPQLIRVGFAQIPPKIENSGSSPAESEQAFKENQIICKQFLGGA
jgi:hypothetical protein